MRETVAAGLERACASGRVVAALAHAAALDDAVARLQLVLHSNDARARTATLRVLGAMAPLLGPRLTVRHTVVRAAVVAALALQAAHTHGDDALPHCAPAAELAAALRAAARLAARAPPFARVLLPVLRALLCGCSSTSSSHVSSVNKDKDKDKDKENVGGTQEGVPLAIAVAPVAAVRPRCACVAALGAMGRDPVLAAEALALCRALVAARSEAPAVRCCAARTAAALGCRTAVGVPRALAALRPVLGARGDAAGVPPRLAACAAACVGALERALLVPVRADARLLGAVAADPRAPVRARCTALAALPVFAPAAPHDPALAEDVAHVLAACTATAAVAPAALESLAPFAAAPAVAAAYHDAAAAADPALLRHFPPQVFWAPTFAPAWRRELVDAAATAAATSARDGAAFLRRCALVARGTAGGRAAWCELLAPHAARLAAAAVAAVAEEGTSTTDAAAETAADVAAALVVGGAPDAQVAAVLARVLAAQHPWPVYRVLRVALGEGRAALAAPVLARLARGTPALATPFRAWLRVLALVARAETLAAPSPAVAPVSEYNDDDDDSEIDDYDDDDDDDDDDDVGVRTQHAVALLLRAVGVLEGCVAPRVPCAAQTRLLRLRADALTADTPAAWGEVARAYERLGAQPRLSAHSRAVLAATAQHCRTRAQTEAPEPRGLWYPPAFFVLQDCFYCHDDDGEGDGNSNC